MKKVLGLFLVIVLSTASLFAQNNRRGGMADRDSLRKERFVAELSLNDKQKAEFQKINEAFIAKAKAEREKQREVMKAEREKQQQKMLAMTEERNAEMKKIMTAEQYQQYLEKQKSRNGSRESFNRDNRPANNKDRSHEQRHRRNDKRR
ncbi:hypothetical protein [Parabacteroides sp. PF5-9]|uniref:hypothetical protein n=1 Tax=Parabacteroides sp. PF5-9 TaxID=1742404 RepID=UPI0024752AD9|nr:hypothetical protein [Parabacteroides sp. PF5-9]MDH6358866.1 biopolymer transport protein ExbB/TolQ [Parabacteroides sp. PF5-9]